MFLTITGAILLVFPFVLLFYFKNRTAGFLYVFIALSGFHLFLAIISQYCHFFQYPIILAINVILCFAIAFWAIENRNRGDFSIKLSWPLIIAAAILIFELGSVHYFYTGKIATIDGNKQAYQGSYPYPYFSDEWAGVAFTSYSISNNALPIINPIMDWGDSPRNFPNIFLAFFSGLSEIFLLLNLTPLTGFPVIALVAGLLICFFVFLFLKTVGVREIAAIFAALSIPWIVNSVNLPGIWFLLPFIGASIFFLIGLVAASLSRRRLFVAANFLSLLIYPPFVVLVIPVLTVVILTDRRSSLKKALLILAGIQTMIFLVAGIIFFFQSSNFQSLASLFSNSLIRINSDGCIPARAIWHIVPLWILPLAIVGVFTALKKKYFYLLAPLLLGLVFWSVYAYSPKFLIIDYARIAVITSFLLVIIGGLGADSFINFLQSSYPGLKKDAGFRIFVSIIIALFVAASFFYTRHEGWRRIVLRFDTPQGLWVKTTNAPANNYLNQDDLEFFAGLKHEKFISLPWKALVIGAATENYPIDSKASIITNSSISYDYFMMLDCVGKEKWLSNLAVKYVYSDRINCPYLIELGRSRENLYFYKFEPGL